VTCDHRLYVHPATELIFGCYRLQDPPLVANPVMLVGVLLDLNPHHCFLIAFVDVVD
jgi:hypothetical protein